MEIDRARFGNLELHILTPFSKITSPIL